MYLIKETSINFEKTYFRQGSFHVNYSFLFNIMIEIIQCVFETRPKSFLIVVILLDFAELFLNSLADCFTSFFLSFNL